MERTRATVIWRRSRLRGTSGNAVSCPVSFGGRPCNPPSLPSFINHLHNHHHYHHHHQSHLPQFFLFILSLSLFLRRRTTTILSLSLSPPPTFSSVIPLHPRIHVSSSSTHALTRPHKSFWCLLSPPSPTSIHLLSPPHSHSSFFTLPSPNPFFSFILTPP